MSYLVDEKRVAELPLNGRNAFQLMELQPGASVTHADVELPKEFTRVMDSAALKDNTMVRARAGDADILLVRQHGRVCALVHSCAHLGGPLSEGTLKDGSVVCPWHGSEFALDDGRVLNGPATNNQPCLTVRERDGHIEVKRPGR